MICSITTPLFSDFFSKILKFPDFSLAIVHFPNIPLFFTRFLDTLFYIYVMRCPCLITLIGEFQLKVYTGVDCKRNLRIRTILKAHHLKAYEQRTENKKKISNKSKKLCKTKTNYQCVRSLNEINHSLGWGDSAYRNRSKKYANQMVIVNLQLD